MFSEYCSFDLEKATEYYEAAKKELGKDTFEFDLLCEDQTETQRVATVIKEQLETCLLYTSGLPFSMNSLARDMQ